jgi:hypothetical protein
MQNKKAYEHSHHGHTGTPGIPYAMVLTVSFVLSPVIGLLPPSSRVLDARLDASVEASRPHDFSVRKPRFVTARPRPPHPAPALVTIAKRPSCGNGMA